MQFQYIFTQIFETFPKLHHWQTQPRMCVLSLLLCISQYCSRYYFIPSSVQCVFLCMKPSLVPLRGKCPITGTLTNDLPSSSCASSSFCHCPSLKRSASRNTPGEHRAAVATVEFLWRSRTNKQFSVFLPVFQCVGNTSSHVPVCIGHRQILPDGQSYSHNNSNTQSRVSHTGC